MSNNEIVEAFCKVLLEAPSLTMTAVRVRLSCSDYELSLKKADPLKPFESMWDSARRAEEQAFPLATAGKEAF